MILYLDTKEEEYMALAGGVPSEVLIIKSSYAIRDYIARIRYLLNKDK